MQRHTEQAKITCQSYVRDRLEIENKNQPDVYCGYQGGLHGLLQHKQYESSNCKFFESQCRKGVRNCGHYEIPLMLYYVSQESDFYLWFDVNVMKKLTIYSNKIF